MSHLFISYSRSDQPYARRLYEELLRRGFDVWIDYSAIEPSRTWWKEIERGVRQCRAFLLVMSPDADASEWIDRETTLALYCKKPVFPLLLRAREDGELMFSALLKTQWENVTDGNLPSETFFGELAKIATPKPEGGGVSVAPPPPDFDLKEAMDQLSLARKEGDPCAALDWIAVIRRSGKLSPFIVKELDRLEPEMRERCARRLAATDAGRMVHAHRAERQQECEQLRVLLDSGLADDPWRALRDFWQRYNGYDPDRLIVRCHPDPEIRSLLSEMFDTRTAPLHRAEIGRRLAERGDPRPGVGLRPDGLPDVVWREVPGGEISLKDGAGTFRVEPFYMVQYPVTYSQFRAFVQDGGYEEDRWWQGLAKRIARSASQAFKFDNYPRENVSWYEAVAFCRWLSAKMGYEARLPTEWEWQQAATGGDPANVYPWGAVFDPARVNWWESGIHQASAAGMFPLGMSLGGVMDLGGNVWEWCFNEYYEPLKSNVGDDDARAVRGGSWGSVDEVDLRAASRHWENPARQAISLGFRCVRSY